jgi:hypothetical protein
VFVLAKKFPRLEVPTVRIGVEAPEEVSAGVRSWRQVDVPPPAEEYVYTAKELQRTLLAYGVAVGVMMSKAHLTEFRLVARGMFTSRLLGLYHLKWCGLARQFMPQNDGPMVSWPPVEELPLEVLVGATIHSQDPMPFPGGQVVIHHQVRSVS